MRSGFQSKAFARFQPMAFAEGFAPFHGKFLFTGVNWGYFQDSAVHSVDVRGLSIFVCLKLFPSQYTTAAPATYSYAAPQQYAQPTTSYVTAAPTTQYTAAAPVQVCLQHNPSMFFCETLACFDSWELSLMSPAWSGPFCW